MSVTDGQIVLSPTLFELGVLPAVDVGKSVSRVGGKAQRPAYRALAGDLKLAYAQFEELEAFARFGARLDEATSLAIGHGRRIRACLNQAESSPVPVAAQIVLLLALAEGLFDAVPLARMTEAEALLRGLTDYERTVALGLGASLRALGPSTLRAHATGPAVLDVVVFGSDQGLVGRFNEVVAEKAASELAALPLKPRVWAVGERLQGHLVDAGLKPHATWAVPCSVHGDPGLGVVLPRAGVLVEGAATKPLPSPVRMRLRFSQ